VTEGEQVQWIVVWSAKVADTEFVYAEDVEEARAKVHASITQRYAGLIQLLDIEIDKPVPT